MVLSPHLTATLRFIFIFALTVANGAALWKAIQKPKRIRRCHANRLSLICILTVNLFYLSFVWTPFTLRTFSFYMRNSTETSVFDKTKASPSIWIQKSILNQPLRESSPSDSLQRTKRRAKVESKGHEGSWSVVFPVMETESERKSAARLPSHISVDCMLQDVVTSASIYCLSFIGITKLILIQKSSVLPSSPYGITGYIFLLIGIPVMATFAIRYGEHLGPNFASHNPDKVLGGYILYNIICDVHIDDTYIFLSFLEWAGLIIVLLLTITFFIAMSTRMEDELLQFKDNAITIEASSALERLSAKIGRWIRDSTLYLATIWAWPLKPSVILVLYVMSGRHWTNTVSWMSHMIIAMSTVFQPLSTLLSVDLYDDDNKTTTHIKQKWNKKDQSYLKHNQIIVSSSHFSPSFPSKAESTDGCLLSLGNPDQPPPSYRECTERSPSPFTQNEPDTAQKEMHSSTKPAKEIRNKLKETYEYLTDKKPDIALSLPEAKGEKTLIFEDKEINKSHLSTSDA